MLPGSSERQVMDVIQKEGSSIFKWNPKLKNGLLSVGGTLESAQRDEDLKHPCILPSHHHVTEPLIQYHHSKVGHLGQESVLSSLRERFWVVKGSSASLFCINVLRRTLKKCLDWQRRRAPTGEQFMSKLPEDRVTSQSTRTPLHTCPCGLFWAHRGEVRKNSSETLGLLIHMLNFPFHTCGSRTQPEYRLHD